jgi:hypothetical protein
MTPAAFKQHIATHRAPPKSVSAALQALWWAKKGDWEKAHRIVMVENSSDAAWVHAHLHRVEGDLDNAGYWYRQARKAVTKGDLELEWDAILDDLIGSRAGGSRPSN